jgi:dTDP-4-dehydrorhamnose reductase
MRIFITGASGQLAKSLTNLYKNEVLYLATKKKLDITNKNEVFRQIDKFKPDIIFHLASMTRGDECAKNPEKAYSVNVEGTRNVVEISKKNNILLLFVSSNEVFDGKKKSPYKETDIPNPITVVGKTKLEAEKIIQANIKKYFIVRTSWLYSKWSTNFLQSVIFKARKSRKVDLVKDEISSPTFSDDLAKGIQKLISKRKYGVFHLSNLGSVSRLKFAEKAFDIYGIEEVEINPIKLDEYVRLSKPPKYSALNISKAKRMGIKMPRWESALKKFLLSVNL